MIRFIGFYNYTVILTYISLISSVLGITEAFHEDYKTAILCLAISGICDAFDGRVARRKKNRTEDEKDFGIQLDSLVDVICFGVFPALICYLLGVRGWLGLVILCFYCICAVIRLAFFNVLEGNRQKKEGGCNKTYRGLPVTTVAFILPVVFCLQFVLPGLAFLILLHVVMALIGILFVLDFRVPKLGFKWILAGIAVVAMIVGLIFVYSSFRAPDNSDENNKIVETIETEEGVEPEAPVLTDADIRALEEGETEQTDGDTSTDVEEPVVGGEAQ